MHSLRLVCSSFSIGLSIDAGFQALSSLILQERAKLHPRLFLRIIFPKIDIAEDFFPRLYFV